MTTTARVIAREIAQRNAGCDDWFEIGLIDWKFGMRRIACTLSAWFQPESTIACLLRAVDELRLPTAPLAEPKPSPFERRQMCDPSHIQLAAAGTRLFFAGSDAM
jgi:hypothetical protein